MVNEDHWPYMKFTGRARLEKSINSLMGIIEGIAIDGVINSVELGFLDLWLAEHTGLRERHPFSELIPAVEGALADGVLTQGEREDLSWLCERLCSPEFFDRTTSDLQRLHAILGGVIADTHITEAELQGLSDWMEEHDHLKTCWPFDEVGSLITSVLADRKIDEQEHELLHAFFGEFIALAGDRTLNRPVIESELRTIIGLCAVCPEITFSGKSFVITGASSRFSRAKFEEAIAALGGRCADNPSKKVDYLVIGSDGNPCWAYACYGRKVEKAIQLRKAGHRLLIVHEHDLHDAFADAR